MNALPEIRTANRVVDLSLRNAALAAVGGVAAGRRRGCWDPARIRLEPGAILPRAPRRTGARSVGDRARL